MSQKMINLNLIFITSISFELFSNRAGSLSFFTFNQTKGWKTKVYLHLKNTESGYIYYYYDYLWYMMQQFNKNVYNTNTNSKVS